MVITLIATLAAATLTPLGRFFLPTFSSTQSYGVLSAAHWGDIVNELSLLFPCFAVFVVAGMAVLAINRRHHAGGRSAARGAEAGSRSEAQPSWLTLRGEWHLIWLILEPCALYLALLNPELGMARDWDLFAIIVVAMVPLAVLILNRMAVLPEAINRARLLASPVFVMGVVLTTAWIAVNASPQKSTTRFEHLLGYDRSTADYAYENLARSYWDSGDMELAIDAMEKACAISQNPRQRLLLANYLRQSGNNTRAIDVLRGILRSRPRYPLTRELLVTLLYDERRHQEVVEAAREGVTMDPDSPVFYYVLGKSLVRLGQPEEGRKALIQSQLRGPSPQISADVEQELRRLGEMR
jgi:tetratricopeptide (TPR) repeat protein